MQFPITVTAITDTAKPAIRPPLMGDKIGDFVSIRPCGKEYDNKTFLGILLGDISRYVDAEFDEASGRLTISHSGYNPAILVPSLGKIILGCESWWGRIKSPDDLKQITNQDIEDVWYVQALKSLAETAQKHQSDSVTRDDGSV